MENSDKLEKVKRALIRINHALCVCLLVFVQFMPQITGGLEPSVITTWVIGYVGIKCIFSLWELLIFPISAILTYILFIKEAQEAELALVVMIGSILFSSLAFMGFGILKYIYEKATGSGDYSD